MPSDLEPALPSLCAVIVTYGARGAMAAEVAARLSAATDHQLVIVHNGSSSPRLISMAPHIHPLELSANCGSAGGYAQGVKAALGLPCQYILLLDDDNALQEGALNKLFSHLQIMAKSSDPSLCAVLAFRKGRFRLTAKGYGRASASAFLGLDLGDAAASLIKKLSRAQRPADQITPDPLTDPLPFCAYGGLLAHRSLFERIGLPREDMVLYADDHEYTQRITAQGGNILLVREAIIDDLDLIDERRTKSGSRGVVGRMVGRLRSKRDFRLYYATRNHVWLGQEFSRTKRLAFYLNAAAFITILTVLALVLWRWKNYALLISAIGDGLAQRGGIKPEFPLP